MIIYLLYLFLHFVAIVIEKLKKLLHLMNVFQVPPLFKHPMVLKETLPNLNIIKIKSNSVLK